MKTTSKKLWTTASFVMCLSLCFAQTPRELRNIDGMLYGRALSALKDKGYNLNHTSNSGGNIYTTYWNSSREKCVTLRANAGRVQSIVSVPNYDCHKDNNGNELSGNRNWKNNSNNRYYHENRSNHYRYNDDRYHDETYSYERGEERIHDLTGKSATWAYEELRDRGFSEQKKHQTDGKTYRVFYNYRTHQCIKTLSEDKRISSIQNSTHCNR